MKTILTLALALSMIVAFIVVFLKAGYSVPAALLMGLGLCLPLVNIGVLLFFLLAEWPIQRELGTLRKRFASELESTATPTQCLSCGAVIPSGAVRCSACGWTYKPEME